MKRFRISKSKSYKVCIFGKGDRFIGFFYDSGFSSIREIISAAEYKMNYKIVTEVVIYCAEDDTYARYNAKGRRI